MDKKKFKFQSQVRVRNYEVDWQGIVHNAVYLQYFEVGRIEYLRRMGVNIDLGSIQNESMVVLARNEVDYRSPAKFDDELTIWSRIPVIRDSSFSFEGIIEEARTGRLIAENIAIHVWLDPRTKRPMTVPNEFRKMVQGFEGETFSNLEPPVFT